MKIRLLPPLSSFRHLSVLAALALIAPLAPANESSLPQDTAAIGTAGHAASDRAISLILDDGTVSCPLPEGETTFVIKIPTPVVHDRFTFLNENAEAAGILKIAVANDRLPVASPKWVEVDGAVDFTRKRIFHLSMVGVDARYVKLSFQVAKAGRLAARGVADGKGTPHEQPIVAAELESHATRVATLP